MGDYETKKVRHSQFNEFLKAKAPEKPCPECGTLNWGTNPTAEDDGEEDPVLQVGLIQGAWTHRILPLHTLYCGNCGFMKFFAASIVDEWVKNNG